MLNDVDIDAGSSTKHELLTAPLFTRAAYLQSRQLSGEEDGQYGVLGHVLGVQFVDRLLLMTSLIHSASITHSSREDSEVPKDKRLYVNTVSPRSIAVTTDCSLSGRTPRSLRSCAEFRVQGNHTPSLCF